MLRRSDGKTPAGAWRRSARLNALRDHLAAGAGQAARGEFIKKFSAVDVVKRAKARARK